MEGERAVEWEKKSDPSDIEFRFGGKDTQKHDYLETQIAAEKFGSV